MTLLHRIVARLLPAFWVLVFGFLCSGMAFGIAIGGQTNSISAIVVPNDAPESLLEAGVELQKCIELATGHNVPIRKEREHVEGSFINLGATRWLEEAGLDPAGLPGDAFRIKSQDGNLYIYGVDTPKGSVTETGGVSRGTANGVYSFLETEMNVRWLMPGNIGRDVPQQSEILIENLDRGGGPVFISRRLPYTQDTDEVRRWLRRQKMGGVFHIEMGHSWNQVVPPDLFNKHPEWFPLLNGERARPRGHYKLEITNPALVRHFADEAIRSLKKNPAKNTFSLSPSDYPDGWSESEESQIYYETDPDGKRSVTPLVLDFYRKVSDLVAKEYPDGKLAGYLYSNFLYPPKNQAEPLPANFYPVLAPSINYSYKLFSPKVRGQFENILKEWSALSENLFYYDLPNVFPFARGGFISPAGPDLLNFLFPRLQAAKVKGVYIYGNNDWAYGAMVNYVLAKMIWDPSLDAKKLQAEWLERAYGPTAGKQIGTLYEKLDQWFADSLNQADLQKDQTIVDDVADYFTQDKINEIYAKHLPAIEEMILAAEKEEMTPAQRERFRLLKNNVTILEWKLKKEGVLTRTNSKLDVSDDAAVEMIFKEEDAFDHFPTLADRGPMPAPVQVSLGQPYPGAAGGMIRVRNRNLVLLYSLEGGPASIDPVFVGATKSFPSYCIKDETNKVIKAGELKAGQSITFDTEKGGIYYLYIPRNPPVYFELAFENLAAAYKTDFYYNRLNLLSKPATLYVNVTQSPWQMSVQTVAPQHTARVNVFDPAGEFVGALETGEKDVEKGTFKGAPGIWRLEVGKGNKGTLNDVFLTFGIGVSTWASVDGRHPLIVSPK